MSHSEKKLPIESQNHSSTTVDAEELVNASGHVQELDRSFGLWSICSLGLLADNAWAAGGGALVVSLYNGGGPGVLYGLVASTVFYSFIGAGLAELASSIPSSASIYHWASITAGPRYGRIASWYAGWWNVIAWIFGAASGNLFGANAIIAMYTVYHPGFVPQRWQIFIAYLGLVWFVTAIVCFGQKYLARIVTFSGVLYALLLLSTILVCAILPSTTGAGYASNAFVWTEWQNLTGWESNGLVFLMGMINGAYTIGTPDAICHCCEEIPKPKTNIPKGILAQLSTGFLTSFVYYITLLYAITSLDDVFNSPITSFPLAAIYQQATRSNAGTFALLFLFFVDITIGIVGGWITASRMLWTLGRDDATPFPSFVGKISPTWRNPFNAQIVCAVVGTLLGLIFIGSQTAFNAFVSVFTIFTTLSYLVPLLTHLFTRHKAYIKPGPFYMPAICAYPILFLASAYIIVFNILYMFPYTYPVANLNTMNWTSVICTGFTFLITVGYLWKRNRGYFGPMVIMDARDDVMTGLIGSDKTVVESRRRAEEATRATLDVGGL